MHAVLAHTSCASENDARANATHARTDAARADIARGCEVLSFLYHCRS